MSDQEQSFRDLKPDEIKSRIESGEYKVVDVREGWEREQRGFIPGSRNVALAQILANPQVHQFRDKTIFACEVGERSAVASEMAVALGVQDVVNRMGAVLAWEGGPALAVGGPFGR